ncbi:hypothetical protein Ancab_033807 [Ancistrocladus abbreviatus]
MEKNSSRNDYTSKNADNNPSKHFHFLFPPHYFHKRPLLSSLFCLPTYLLALLLILLLAYNAITVFYIFVAFPGKNSSEPANFLPENVRGSARKWVTSSMKLSSNVLRAIKEANPPVISKTHVTSFHNSHSFPLQWNHSSSFPPKKRCRVKRVVGIPPIEAKGSLFSTRVKEFFSNYSCELRFFMTWISSLERFGYRELFTIESLFNSHPDACLLILSNSMDSTRGMQILMPFLVKDFKLMAVSPDYDYLFNNTLAAAWFDGLRKGDTNPGKVPFGQNLSNLLRLSLLYNYGGIYMDTDFVVLKRFSLLRNVIGAQNVDPKTGKWSRLNNAVMIFDKKHPLLSAFIQEFTLTFNGNRWGYNGPYLVSRVVKRVNGKPGYNFTVLPPSAFYPVGWRRISSLFEGPRDELQSKWLGSKLEEIRGHSLAVHLWNRQSRSMTVEEGSIVSHLMVDCCVFCNSSAPAL